MPDFSPFMWETVTGRYFLYLKLLILKNNVFTSDGSPSLSRKDFYEWNLKWNICWQGLKLFPNLKKKSRDCPETMVVTVLIATLLRPLRHRCCLSSHGLIYLIWKCKTYVSWNLVLLKHKIVRGVPNGFYKTGQSPGGQYRAHAWPPNNRKKKN